MKNQQIRKTVNDYFELISKEDLKNYLNNHNLGETEKYFNISRYLLKQLCEIYNIDFKSKKFIKFNELLKTVSADEFKNFYFLHSREETQSHFKIGSTVFNKFMKYYNIVKSSIDIDQIRKKTVFDRYNVLSVAQLEENKQKSKQTRFNLYGNENYVNIEQALLTRELKYGSKSYHNIKQQKKTMLEKYGVEFALQSNIFVQKRAETLDLKYNDSHYHNIEKMKQTNLERIGVEYNFASDNPNINGRGTQYKIYEETGIWNNRPQAIQTCKDLYGDDFYIKQVDLMLSSTASKANSKINDDFYDLLISMGIIPQQREFNIGNYWYDFKLGNYLIELDPYATHNSSWGLFNNPKLPDYHRNKTLNALNDGYKCIHIFDWLSIEPIIYHILQKDLDIIDTGKAVKHIFDIKQMKLTNKESDNTVIIYDDGFNLIY